MAKKKTAPKADPNQPLIDAIHAGDEKEVMRIIDAGTDPGVMLYPATRETAFDIAIAYEHPALAMKLLARGAKVGPGTLRAIRASSPDKLWNLIELPDDEQEIRTLLSSLGAWEREAAGRKKLVTRFVKMGLELSQSTLFWMMVGMNCADEDEINWAIDLHLKAKVKLDVNAPLNDASEWSLMTTAMNECSLGIVKRFVEMGGKIKPGQKVEATVEDAAAKKKWLADNRPRGKSKSGLDLFSNLTDDELTDDVVVANLIGKTEVFPDREKWLTLAWNENAADTRAHQLDSTYAGGLRYEFFINSDSSWNDAVAQSKALYTRLYAELTKLYGKTKKGTKDTDWDVGVHLELTQCHENPYGPFNDHWAGVAVQLDVM